MHTNEDQHTPEDEPVHEELLRSPVPGSPVSNRTASHSTAVSSQPESALEATLVDVLVQDLDKAVKAICLYPPSNPICASARERFVERLLRALESGGKLSLGVAQDTFTYQDQPLKTGGPESSQLPSLCYACGITELNFDSNLTAESIDTFLTVLRTVITRAEGDIDLTEALWGETIPGFSYEKVEDLPFTDYDSEIKAQYFSEQDSAAKPGYLAGDENDPNYGQMFVGDSFTELEEPDSPSADSFERVVTTLSDDGPLDDAQEDGGSTSGTESQMESPTPKAREMLQRIFELDMDESQRAAFTLAKDAIFSEADELVNISVDLLDLEEHLSGIIDVMAVFTRAHGSLVSSGNLTVATRLLKSLHTVRERYKQSQPIWEAKISETISSICSRERLTTVSDALNNNPQISAAEITTYLTEYDWTSFSALSELLGGLDHKSHRLALCGFLAGIDKQHVDLIASGMYDKRWYVVRNTAMILAGYDDNRAHKHLLKALEHTDRRVRLEVIKSAASHDANFVRQVALSGVHDKDEEIQNMALDLALRQSGESAFELFTALVEKVGLDKLPSTATEKALLGYSLSGNKHAVPFLSKLAGSWGLFDRTPQHIRREAIAALTHNPSPEATASLKKLNRSWNTDVRQLARGALNERMSETFQSQEKN